MTGEKAKPLNKLIIDYENIRLPNEIKLSDMHKDEQESNDILNKNSEGNSTHSEDSINDLAKLLSNKIESLSESKIIDQALVKNVNYYFSLKNHNHIRINENTLVDNEENQMTSNMIDEMERKILQENTQEKVIQVGFEEINHEVEIIENSHLRQDFNNQLNYRIPNTADVNRFNTRDSQGQVEEQTIISEFPNWSLYYLKKFVLKTN